MTLLKKNNNKNNKNFNLITISLIFLGLFDLTRFIDIKSRHDFFMEVSHESFTPSLIRKDDTHNRLPTSPTPNPSFYPSVNQEGRIRPTVRTITAVLRNCVSQVLVVSSVSSTVILKYRENPGLTSLGPFIKSVSLHGPIPSEIDSQK